MTPRSMDKTASLRGRVSEKLRRAAEELASEIWADLDEVRQKTNLTDAWGLIGELCGDDIIRFATDTVLPALSSDSVSDGSKGARVKPLTWQPIGPVGSDVEAETPIGTYTMSFDALSAGGGVNLWMAGADVDTFTVHDKRKNAEAAAQADYEQRILSALDSGTGGQQPVADVCETCGGTGNEATHQICRDCDGLDPTEPKAGVVSEDMAARPDQHIKEG